MNPWSSFRLDLTLLFTSTQNQSMRLYLPICTYLALTPRSVLQAMQQTTLHMAACLYM